MTPMKNTIAIDNRMSAVRVLCVNSIVLPLPYFTTGGVSNV